MWQGLAGCCGLLQFVAVCCSTIRRLHTFVIAYVLELVLRCVQCVTERCRALQCAAVCCSAIRSAYIFIVHAHQIHMLQHVAMSCSVLQCVAAQSIYQKRSIQVERELQKNLQQRVLIEISLAFKATLTFMFF